MDTTRATEGTALRSRREGSASLPPKTAGAHPNREWEPAAVAAAAAATATITASAAAGSRPPSPHQGHTHAGWGGPLWWWRSAHQALAADGAARQQHQLQQQEEAEDSFRSLRGRPKLTPPPHPLRAALAEVSSRQIMHLGVDAAELNEGTTTQRSAAKRDYREWRCWWGRAVAASTAAAIRLPSAPNLGALSGSSGHCLSARPGSRAAPVAPATDRVTNNRANRRKNGLTVGPRGRR